MGGAWICGHARWSHERSERSRVAGTDRAADRSKSFGCIGAKYQKQRFFERLIWTIASNLALLRGAFAAMRAADLVLFTGSPPLMLHFIAPLNVVLRRRLVYRIMDFHPECLIAERGKSGLLLAGSALAHPFLAAPHRRI